MATEKLTYEQFILRAIPALTKEGQKGIHSRNSGFNSVFRKYYNKDNKDMTCVKAVEDLAKTGKIAIRPTKGGVVMYLPENYEGSSVDKTLDKILNG